MSPSDSLAAPAPDFETVSLVPRPRRARRLGGVVTLDPSRIEADEQARDAAEYLRHRFFEAAGVIPARSGVGITRGDGATPIHLAVANDPDDLPPGPRGDRAEAFRLSVTSDRIEIVGGGAAGVFYGVQALLQLLPAGVYRRAGRSAISWRIPTIIVEDAPVFAWRGVMLDVVRHFRTTHEVLRIIDQLAAHRINRLHLHLTDDQGWRVQIRKYPRLTEVGGWRKESEVGAHVLGDDGVLRAELFDGRPHGGYYTQADIREIVAYAQTRHVTVVPEIETPGHVRAALAAYPELGVTGRAVDVWTEWGVCSDVLNAEEATIRFFQDVLDEVIALFPSSYIGIGGDECPKQQWMDDPRTQARIRELGLRNEEELQAWMVQRLASHIENSGRRAFGWDEILEGGTLSPSATVLSWRGRQGAVTAARRGHDVISSPDDQVYLDYRQSEMASEPIPVSVALTIADVYAFDPIPAGLDDVAAARVIGGQGNLWTEHIDSARSVDYMLFPRVVALAEALWSADATHRRDFAEFRGRLQVHFARLQAMGIEYRLPTGPLPWQQRPGIPGRPMSRDALEAHVQAITANISA